MDQAVKDKLHPRSFPKISKQFSAIVGYFCGERYTEPEIEGIVITSDGYVLVSHDDEIGMNNMIGTASDLKRNWDGYITAAELTDAEREQAQLAFVKRIVDFRQVRA